jgi:hypothetical protein
VGVTILAVLYFIGAAFLGCGGLFFIVGGAALGHVLQSGGPATALFAAGGAVVGVFMFVLAILDVALGIGFLKLQNWARVVAIVLIGIGTAFGLLGMLVLMLHFMIFALIIRVIVLAIQIWILIYLFRPHVKQAFGATGF